jgi:hypothetical protein
MTSRLYEYLCLRDSRKDILPDNKHGSEAEVATVKVAMLYEQAPETRLEDRRHAAYAEDSEAHDLVIEYESVIDTGVEDRKTIKNAIA